MYHLASCLLALGNPQESLGLLKKVMEEDQDANHMHPLFKHFAFGKALHALGRFDESLQHLETAAHRADRGQATDFVWELAARNALCMGKPDKAKASIDRINPARRRPYVQWTESDVLVALGRRKEAIKLLEKSASTDRRSRHKSLIRICRILLSLGDFANALDAVRAAENFCVENFGNPPKEGKFWEAVCLYRMERSADALPIIAELEAQRYNSQHFDRLARLVRENVIPRSAGGRVSLDPVVNATSL
jgi:tetratricopeptide (TPR) repeat protein